MSKNNLPDGATGATDDTGTQLLTDQSISSSYTFTIKDCRFVECSDETNRPAGDIKPDGLALKVGPWAAVISHEAPGRLTVCYTDPVTSQRKYFYRVLKQGTFKVESTPKLCAHWDDVVPILTLLSDNFGITWMERSDPNCPYVCDSCQHENPDGKHRLCFAITDGIMRTFLHDDLTGSFDPDDPESMFFYTGEVEYRVSNATWVVIGEAVTADDSSYLSKDIRLYVRREHPNLYLFLLELDDFLDKNGRGSFEDYLVELKDLI